VRARVPEIVHVEAESAPDEAQNDPLPAGFAVLDASPV
jgi:hypothetical protein